MAADEGRGGPADIPALLIHSAFNSWQDLGV